MPTITRLAAIAFLATAGNLPALAAHHAHAEAPSAAIAVIQGTEGNDVSGHVRFTPVDGGVRIRAEIHGLNPDSHHGIHIHEYGDISATDGTSAGGHYNPEGHDHGLPGASDQRHAGDLGNLRADAKGHAVLELEVDNITLAGDRNPIIGRAIIIHAGTDDGGQPTGNSGARMAMGVIGVDAAE